MLKDEGFILDYQVGEMAPTSRARLTFSHADADRRPAQDASLRIFLKYGPEGEQVIRHIERASRPGRRLYRRQPSSGRCSTAWASPSSAPARAS